VDDQNHLSLEGRYPERGVQAGAVAWLTNNAAYTECFCDIAAVGARMDTVGSLAGRLLLAEVKVIVGLGIVEHRPDRSMSLEAKIANTLAGLYAGGDDPLSVSARSVWDQSAPPLIGIIAVSYSAPALSALETMLTKRSHEWLFDWVIWRWQDPELAALKEGQATSVSAHGYADLAVPRLTGRTPRAARLGRHALEALAETLGCAAHVQAFTSEATNRGMRITRGRKSLTAAKKVGNKWVTVLGLYLDGSTAASANVGVSDELAQLDRKQLPGASAPAEGYLNINRWIATPREMTLMFDMGEKHLPLLL
jgi:hypothetical protein